MLNAVSGQTICIFNGLGTQMRANPVRFSCATFHDLSRGADSLLCLQNKGVFLQTNRVCLVCGRCARLRVCVCVRACAVVDLDLLCRHLGRGNVRTIKQNTTRAPIDASNTQIDLPRSGTPSDWVNVLHAVDGIGAFPTNMRKMRKVGRTVESCVVRIFWPHIKMSPPEGMRLATGCARP